MGKNNRREFLKMTTVSGIGIGLSTKLGDLLDDNTILGLRKSITPFDQIKVSKNDITIANEVIRKKIAISQKRPGAIAINSIFDKVNNRELISSSAGLPWFEFVINHQLVTSNDPVWQFESLSKRSMANKGTEYTLHFKGASYPVKGLLISIKEQIFPQSTLIREKLILHVNGKDEFELNKIENKLHFIFPQYAYKVTQFPVKSKEIRIATWDGEVLDELNNSSYDTRFMDYRLDYGGDHNLSQAHMYHPKIIERQLNPDNSISFKGPVGLLTNRSHTFLMAYEHASQDNMIPDEAHEYAGFSEEYLHFLQISHKLESGRMSSAVKINRGGYLDGEQINAANIYETVWVATGFFSNKEQGQPQKLLYNYLLRWITEFPQTRETRFYYNTWAMQVNARRKGKHTEDIINYDRLFEEIKHAHQLGVDIFILDASWQESAGVWKPSTKRLAKGLAPVYEALKKYNMTLGLWMAPLDVSPDAERFKQHPEWIIEDDGIPADRKGKIHFFDFVSGYSDLFIADCKKLIDQGVRYFKWDDIGTYYSSCTSGHHGGDRDPEEDVIARYGYLLPLYISKAMIALMNYNPDVVIEIDLTENARALMGLATISAGKLFFINNGASDYGDYSQFRAKSTRAVANIYNEILPLQLFTYANYPFNSLPFMAQRYNVNSSFICGRGFWGDLSQMRPEQRARVGKLTDKIKEIRPFINNTRTSVIGKVGASPEVYTTVNATEAVGQVVAFSGSAMNYKHQITLNNEYFLGVINNAFALKGDTLDLYFQFPMPDASREAFILPNRNSGIRILSCSSWLDAIHLNENKLKVVCGAPGAMLISWPKNRNYPKISGDKLETSIHAEGNYYLIKIGVQHSNTRILIE